MGPLELKIADLVLDLKNPRFGGASSQRDALEKIIHDQQDKLITLAESVIEDGMNPMDRLLVLAESKGTKRFVALEGNRRVAALKILATPSMLQGMDLRTAHRRAFEKLAKSFDRNSVEPISCFEVEDRAAGNAWIHLRHTGANGGKGVVAWSGVAAARFRGQAPGLQALEFVKSHGSLSEDQKAAIEDRFPITTLDRLLSSRAVRDRLGFDVVNGKLVTGLPPEELLKPLRRMVLDLAEKRYTVSNLKNKEQQAEYVDAFDKASQPSLDKRGAVKPVDNFGTADFARTIRAQKRSRVADPSARRALVPRGKRLNIADSRIAAIYKELCLLKVVEHKNAVAVLFRVFLELSVDDYMERGKLPIRYKEPKSGRMLEKTLSQKVADVVDHLVAAGKNKKDYASVIRGLSVEKSPLYIDLLHAYVHNRFAIPKSHDLLASWDEAQRFFEDLWP